MRWWLLIAMAGCTSSGFDLDVTVRGEGGTLMTEGAVNGLLITTYHFDSFSDALAHPPVLRIHDAGGEHDVDVSIEVCREYLDSEHASFEYFIDLGRQLYYVQIEQFDCGGGPTRIVD